MSRTMPAVMIALSLLLAGAVAAQNPIEGREENISKFMRAKLTLTQQTLESIALEDYEQIAKRAQAISLMSQAETWMVLQTPEYLQHSTEFRRSADALRDAGLKKNLDGAALAYVDLTLKCVNCHKYVRRAKMAAVEPKVGDLQELIARSHTAPRLQK